MAEPKHKTPARRYAPLKRLLDVLCAAGLLLLLGLPMAGIGLLVCLTSRGGALFRQERVGRRGKRFVCYKFRTMKVQAPPHCPTAALKDAERWITPMGRWLRKSSLDELPQLWNVLRGEMSLVGPRPLIPQEENVHRLRRQNGAWHLRPGMTGLAQVHGRDRLSDEEKVRWDARYAERMCLGTDVRILARSLLYVLFGRDVAEGDALGRSS